MNKNPTSQQNHRGAFMKKSQAGNGLIENFHEIAREKFLHRA